MNIIKKINKADSIWEILPSLLEEDLEKVIKLSADSYYNSGVTLISDEYYDTIVDRLKELNPKSPALKQIGAPVQGRQKVVLPYYMGSMDKIKADNDKALKKFLSQYKGPFLISDKLDGISGLANKNSCKSNKKKGIDCDLKIVNGQMKLYTRGDGNIAQDISHLVPLINMSIDKLLKLDLEEIAIRGELIMSIANFKKYAKTMSNARSMVSGIVNSKEQSVNKKHAADVDFVAYEIIEPYELPLDQMRILKKWGLNVVYHDLYNDIDLNILDTILQKRKKKSLYEIDGIIITDNNKHPRNKSGNPSYSFAYKGKTETADVKVIDVIWKPSKDGILVPTVFFEKVRLSQADLQMATGFNAKFIVDNEIGPGSIIRIVRSGDVIPYIMAVVKPAKHPSLPDPEDLEYEWDDNGVNIILLNPADNETVIIQRLTKFMRYIGVDNLSEGIVTRLVKAGYDTIPKMITLTVDDFMSVEGFQKTLAKKLYNNLQNALDDLDLLTLMAASNVFGRGFGERKIKKILDSYPNIVDEYSAKTHKKWEANLMDLEGFDIITVDSFLSALPDFQKFYKNIIKIIDVKPYVLKVKTGGIFKNQTVVFTGFRNKQWQDFIEGEGGKVTGSVSKNTTLLVYKDGEESSSKYQTAKKLGIRTISQSEFSKKYKI